MRETRIMMGMPITVHVVDATDGAIINAVFDFFGRVDRRFSTYRADSEISAINRNEIAATDYSTEMKEVLDLAARTRSETEGYFDIRRPDGLIDPSGIVKGWAIKKAAELAVAMGARDFYIDAGGDIQSAGVNETGQPWSVGIRNPFDDREIVKVVYPHGRGMATSGSYVRGQHIYNPHKPGHALDEIVSITVVAGDVLEADRYATAAFAMGRDGIRFIQRTPGLDAYMIGHDRRATMTEGFAELCQP
jgi:thiamine biosynthesis lipoprotein